jgi:uncharacterized membrane protein YbaN (DUF454 family)
MKAIRHYALTVLGFVLLVLGIAGAFLPLLPTTPFLLAALACFSRSFPRLEARLLRHPVLGKPLRDWRQSGAISRRAKLLAVSMIVLGYGVFLATTDLGLPVQLGVALVLSICAIFILSRPAAAEPHRPQGEPSSAGRG